MVRTLKPAAVVGIAGITTLVLYGLVPGAPHLSLPEAVASGADAFGRGYQLGELEILEPTLYHVEESYVEPGRIDWDLMLEVALEAVERRVPTILFKRDPTLLHMEVGEFSTHYEVPRVVTRGDLQRELESVAALLQEHLDPEDVPLAHPDDDALAEVEYAMINGALSTLDPHSVLLPPEDSKEMDVENEGEFGGLGITIIIDPKTRRLTIDYPLPGTPAEKAGLQARDQIMRIDGESTINMTLNEAVTRLRGPVGEPVTIDVKRAGMPDAIEVEVVRDRIKLQPVAAQMLDGGIGYVSIESFHAQVEQQLHQELARLKREPGGLNGLIIDLRDDSGGYLNQAIAVADTFLEEGVIVSTVDGNNRMRDREEAHSRGTEPRYPMAVLVNAGSASASEIVAGALRNQERAVIIGERTFGKGSVQNLYPFYDDSKLKLTISKYLTPHDRSIQSVGIPADIALMPTVVDQPEDEDTGEISNLALLYWRERVRREADLDKHLEQVEIKVDEPIYSLRYWRPFDRGPRVYPPDLSKDYEVQFARDLLVAAPSWRRADILRAATPVVESHRRSATAELNDKLAQLGLDWSTGPSVQTAKLGVELLLGEGGTLHAGAEEQVTLEVTNQGTEPLYQLVAVADFGNEFLDTREFPIGKLEPGQTRSWTHDVSIGAGYPTEQTPVSITFRDVGNDRLLVQETVAAVQGAPLPRLHWSWKTSEKQGGNGDGNMDVGEEIRVTLVVENVGAGPTSEPVARIKNLSGKGLDIVRGTLEPGFWRDAEGQECQPIEGGLEGGRAVGDPAQWADRIQAGDPPTYPEGCERSLLPGETWEGDFVVILKPSQEHERTFKLSLGDASAYDYAAIVRAGFYEYFTNEEEISLRVGGPTIAVAQRKPPVVEVSTQPGPTTDRQRVTVSGVVTDDTGIGYVMVYDQRVSPGTTLDMAEVLRPNDAHLAPDKVFFQGARQDRAVRSVPFTADVSLEPGLNTVAILARDEDGYHATASVVTFYMAPETQAQSTE